MASEDNRKRNAYGQPYTVLSEPELSAELARLALAQSPTTDTDVVSLQPCPSPGERSQDRFFVADWALSGGTWRFRAIWDGHAGHDTVDHAKNVMPSAIHDALIAALANANGVSVEPKVVSDLIRDTIESVDKKIGDEFTALFPGGPDSIAAMSDEQITAIINDDTDNNAKTLRCMRGTTVLVSLISPNLDVWVASLGDCQAVLGVKQASGEWTTSVLSSNHNGTDASEAERIRKEHPDEEECLLHNRVLGALAVTRALGDFEFKLPPIYTMRVYMLCKPGFRVSSSVVDFSTRNLTPPYVSAVSDVQHIKVEAAGVQEALLVLASDGLVDLSGDSYGMDHREPEISGRKWIEVLGRGDRKGNKALWLLRDAMGQEEDKVSSLLTLESEGRWMDDTTIICTSLF
ncbi:Serine/threonine protein phosphatase 2C [Mycena kentingensis (nom. inval.)]|nr:Serine/threonine protein phosphatase 2C [Mycena kentingensis (nom. inval.)]